MTDVKPFPILFSCTNRAYQDVSVVWAHSYKRSCEDFPQNKNYRVVLFCTPDVDESVFEGTGIELRYLPVMGGVEKGLFEKTCMEGMVMRLTAMDYLHAEGEDYVVYMDTDILVRGDISELAKAPLTNELPLAAASDFMFQPDERLGMAYEQLIPDYPRRMKINTRYFNSGVMILKLSALVEETKKYSCTSLEDFYMKHKDLCRFPDQDALNKLAQNFLVLPRRFNAFAEFHIHIVMSSDELMDHRKWLCESAVLLHYLSIFKPWSPQKRIVQTSMQIPFELYWEAVKPVKHLLDPAFVETVKENVESHRIVIEQARRARYDLGE